MLIIEIVIAGTYPPISAKEIPHSAKFSRRIIFAVFADSFLTAKIKFLETFRLNYSGVCGMVWKQNDSYSTFALLRGRQEQHGTLYIVVSKRTLPDSWGPPS